MSSSHRGQWSDFPSLRDVMGNLMPSSAARMRESESMGMYVPIDLWETNHEYIVKAFIPGARSEDIHIQVHGDTLRISGETKEETPEQGKPGRWLIREHRAGHFQRTITLPQPVQADQVEADFHQGVLTVRLPESEESRPRTIPIRMATTGQEAQSQAQSMGGQRSTGGQTSPSSQSTSTGQISTSGQGQATQSGRPSEEYSPTERGAGAPLSPTSNSSPGAIDRWMSQVKAGMTVAGSDGLSVGHVTQVHPNGGNFLLERPGGDEAAIWVPLTAISAVSGDQITLGVPSAEIDQQGWEISEIPGLSM